MSKTILITGASTGGAIKTGRPLSNKPARDLARAMTKVLCRRATIAERFVLNIVDLNPRPRNS
jgi:hypothetical protein